MGAEWAMGLVTAKVMGLVTAKVMGLVTAKVMGTPMAMPMAMRLPRQEEPAQDSNRRSLWTP